MSDPSTRAATPARDQGWRSVPWDVLRGALMGAADAVPGVSGGTVALIVGVYERLLIAIRAVAASVVLGVAARGQAVRARLAEVDWRMLLPLVAGIGLAYPLAMITVAETVSSGHPWRVPVTALLLGLVLGSIRVPWRRLRQRRPAHLVVVALAAALGFLLTGLPPAEIAAPALPVVFVGAAIGICAMILPGVSGAFLLQAMGLYQAVGTALRELDLALLATFAAGAAVGLGSFAKLLTWLLARAHDWTMAVLTGLLIGALRALWPWIAGDRALQAPPADPETALAAALALVGAAAVVALTWLGERGDAGR